MKNNQKETRGPVVPFCIQSLKELKKHGFKFLLVKGYGHDGRIDYIEPESIILVPAMELAGGDYEGVIYEPIDSPLLVSWANAPEEGVKVFLCR